MVAERMVVVWGVLKVVFWNECGFVRKGMGYYSIDEQDRI
jgi:hypothetical protein